MDGLWSALKARDSGQISESKANVSSNFVSSGYVALLAAHCYQNKILEVDCSVPDNVSGYLSAMGFSREVWGNDDYDHERRNEGRTYSSLVHLRNPTQVDTATETINSCLREFVPATPGLNQLCHVVGELHDNVWSHGLASGFSMAQSWKVPYAEDRFIEFGIADVGLGFLAELKAKSVAVESDAEAIEWCLIKGHTSKQPVDDEWAQALPNDAVGNPYGDNVNTFQRGDGSHHLGLGLHHLIELTRNCKGTITIASGSKCLFQGESGARIWHDLEAPWQGVAISCRVKQSKLNEFTKQPLSDIETEIESALTRGWDD